MSLQYTRIDSAASKMSSGDYVGSRTSASASSTLLNNTSTTGWYARLSGLWGSVVSTLRSNTSLRNETQFPDSKTSTTSSRTDKSTSSSSSCTETSDTWKYKGDNKAKSCKLKSDGHTYYNLIEDFPYGGFCGQAVSSVENGGPSHGMIVGELFPEEEIFNQEDQQESIIPIQVLTDTPS